MTQYNTLHVKLSSLQLNKLKYGIKNDTEVTFKISSNVVGDSNNENGFLYKLLLTYTHFTKFRKAFSNNYSASIKSSKTQLHKIGQSGRFLSRLLGPLLKISLPLIGNVLKPLAENVSILLGLTAAASATDAAIHKKTFASGIRHLDLPKQTALIISNEETNDIMKIIKFLEESGLLIKGVSKTIKNEAKEQKGGFLGILLGTLDASLLENLLTGKGTFGTGEGTIRAGQDF